MTHAPWKAKDLRTILLATITTFFISAPVLAQPNGSASQDDRTVRDNDNDAVHGGLGAFDRFMDSHPDIAAQVRQKPWLLNNWDFLQSHPDLNNFLQSHPQLRTEISQNSVVFMQTANLLDTPDGRRDLVSFDRFLDTHPDVTAQLRQKPWLVTNYQFLQSHPDLNSFLQDHPQLHNQIGQNPVAFMQEENLFDQPEAARGGDVDQGRNINNGNPDRDRGVDNRDRDANASNRDPDRDRDAASNRDADRNRDFDNRGDRDASASNRDFDNRDRDANGSMRQDLAAFDRFLDSHRDIAQQLQQNPSLIDQKSFIKGNPPLKEFLKQNPGVRDQLRSNPTAFMQAEQQYDNRENSRGGDRDVNNRDRDRDRDATASNRDADRGDRDANASNRDRDADNRDRDANASNRDFGDRDRDANASNRDFDNRDRDRDSAQFRQFLDTHPEVGEQVRRNPSLLDNREFVENHPDLKTYVENHPQLQNEIREDQYAFVQRDDNDRNFNGGNRYGNGGDYGRDNNNGVNRDHAADFGRFLGQHADIARDCNQNPAILKDHQYLDNHPALVAYLNANPEVKDELMQNPQTFIKEAQQLNYNGSGTAGTGTTGGSGTTGTTGGNHTSGTGNTGTTGSSSPNTTGTGAGGGTGSTGDNSTSGSGSTGSSTNPSKTK